jgi:hypothetical protein
MSPAYRVEVGVHRLQVVLGPADHDVVHQDAGDLDVLRVQGAVLDDVLHLHDHDAAAGPRRLGDRQRLQQHALAGHRHVAVLVGIRAAQQRHIHLGVAEVQPLLAIQVHHLDQVFGGGRIHLGALDARIDEGLQPHLGQKARPPPGHLLGNLHQHALGQVVGLDLVVHDEAHQLRPADAEVPADDALQQALGGKVVHAPVLAVAHAGGVVEREVARVAGGVEGFADRLDRLFGKARQAHAGAVHGGAVLDQVADVAGCDDSRHVCPLALTCRPAGRRRRGG